jgi:hypothetical protein
MVFACVALYATACSAGAQAARPKAVPRRPVTTTAASTATSTSTAAPPLVAWNGPVEHLFFHTLVIRPQLAFTHDRIGQGFRDWFVTAGEFRKIVEQLYANGWTLVDIHRAVDHTARVPPGRKPFVLSVDDVNYYDNTRAHGVGWRLALDARGAVKVEVHDGNRVRVTDDDVVPIVDGFVARHPLFSADGAKGILAVTGYEGVLGERLDDAASVERATALATRLRATGWTFASHSYAHFDERTHSVEQLTRDALKWRIVAERIVGPTDVYVFPFGAGYPLDSPKIGVLRVFGFTIFCDIDAVARMTTENGVTMMSRRHVDGVAFTDAPQRLARFFDVATVEDVSDRR